MPATGFISANVLSIGVGVMPTFPVISLTTLLLFSVQYAIWEGPRLANQNDRRIHAFGRKIYAFDRMLDGSH